MAINSVYLDGRLTADPVSKEVNGEDVKEFTLAQDAGKSSERSRFFDVEVWGGWARNLKAKKGDPVMVEGRLEHDSWKDKETGKQRSRVYVRAQAVKQLAARDSGAAESVKTDYQFI